jgi:hypothetical protein
MVTGASFAPVTTYFNYLCNMKIILPYSKGQIKRTITQMKLLGKLLFYVQSCLLGCTAV